MTSYFQDGGYDVITVCLSVCLSISND